MLDEKKNNLKIDGKGNWPLDNYTISNDNSCLAVGGISELSPANPQHGKPQRKLLRSSRARDPHNKH